MRSRTDRAPATRTPEGATRLRAGFRRRRGWRGALLAAGAMAALCASCTKLIFVYGRYQTTIAAIEPPRQWGHSPHARFMGIIDWDLQKYMWSQLTGFTTGPIELNFGAVADTRCQVKCIQCAPDLLSQDVVLRVFVRETPELGGDLLPFADTPVLTLGELLAPPPTTWAWIPYAGAGRSMLDYALHHRVAQVQLVCEIEFQSLAQDDLPVSYMTVDLDMPWTAEMTP